MERTSSISLKSENQEKAAIPEQLSPKASNRRLLMFGAIVLFVFLGSMISGYLMRGELREWAGPLHVEVINNSDEKTRTDILTDSDTVTLELDPGATGLLRFRPSKTTPIEVRLFDGMEFLNSQTHGSYQPQEDYLVRVTITEEGNILFKDVTR